MKVILISSLLFGVALADLSCECGKRNAGRIVGGTETKKNEYPWMVSLQTRDDINTFCGGAIITPWHVVTATHCVVNQKAKNLVLVVGAHDVNNFRDSTRKELYVDEIVTHPEYENITHYADIAVLVTSTEIVFNENIGPACMPKGKLEEEMKGQMVKAMGWGRYDHTKPNRDRVNTLKEIDMEIISVKACKGFKGYKICAYAPRKGTCKGDSGGPVTWLDPEVNRFTLVGVVSSGPVNCGKSDAPTVHTNVSFFSKWINDIIARTKSQAKTCLKA